MSYDAPLGSEPERLWNKIWLDEGQISLQAARNINPGDLILFEKPIFGYPPFPPQNRHPEHFLDETKRYNGKDTVAKVIATMPANELALLRKLFGWNERQSNEDEPVADIAIIATNAFTHYRHIAGVKHAEVRVFYAMSRCNHSCVPNAVIEWNDTLKQGTLYALEAIAQGKKILVDYLGNPEDTLQGGVARCKLLKDQYDFTCKCSACRNKKGQPNAADDKLRMTALDLYRNIQWDSGIITSKSEMTLELSQIWENEITALEKYVSTLKALNLNDGNLAEACHQLTKACEQLYHIAKRREALEAAINSLLRWLRRLRQSTSRRQSNMLERLGRSSWSTVVGSIRTSWSQDILKAVLWT